MNLFVNICVIATTLLAFGYLCYVLLWPEQF